MIIPLTILIKSWPSFEYLRTRLLAMKKKNKSKSQTQLDDERLICGLCEKPIELTGIHGWDEEYDILCYACIVKRNPVYEQLRKRPNLF